ncbi:peptidoglycan-binding protein [Streptomyces sp. NPDC060223]|uniref:peptidoglycan-binding domain-containing protein n=1 Tax=unclassified Streptomyces TaxID=2593676 RepID=UPI003633FD23
MTEPDRHVCPECTAPRTRQGTPTCDCTQRASDALRDVRTAEAAAAEDFDPLRIRPYVELEAGEVGTGTTALVPKYAPVPVTAPELSEGASAATMRLAAVPGGAVVGVGVEAEAGVGVRLDATPPRRRRRFVFLGVGGAAVTVLAAAGFASGFFMYESPSRDEAAPDLIRASVPDAPPSSASASPSASESSAAPVPAAPAPSPSTSHSPTAPPRSSPVAIPSSSATPTRTTTTENADDAVEATGVAPGDELEAQSLRRGDQGPEVTELQLRLTELALYIGEANGDYDSQVEEAVTRYQLARGLTADELGVYGRTTRTSLEAETTEP